MRNPKQIKDSPGRIGNAQLGETALDSQVDALLLAFVKHFAFQDDEGRWWGMDTNLGKQEETFATAKKSIKELL